MPSAKFITVRHWAPLLAALALCGCGRATTQSYVMIDPATGRQVAYAQPQYAAAPAQQSYAQAVPAQGGTGGPYAAAQPQYGQYRYGQVYAQQAYTPQSYAPPRAQGYAGAYAASPYAANPYAAYASAPAIPPSYAMDTGDRLRIVVFGQDGISNSYIVDAAGNVNLPLIGSVPARGTEPAQLARLITEKLRAGYVREPHVSVEVEAYRPFFILGEVTNPGQYAYVPDMTAETAVAIAGGFAPRARKSEIELTRTASGQQFHGKAPLNTPIRPGDTIVIKERWF